jgi:hypothetical protein
MTIAARAAPFSEASPGSASRSCGIFLRTSHAARRSGGQVGRALERAPATVPIIGGEARSELPAKLAGRDRVGDIDRKLDAGVTLARVGFELVLATHGAPTDQAALERALS